MTLPAVEGETHINIYSKSKIELGRFLSNFAKVPITTEDGPFMSIEGYWYWLSNHDEQMRALYGYDAKKVGKSLPREFRLEEEEFRRKIREACWIKLHVDKRMYDTFKASKPQFTHYYMFGGYAKDAGFKWIVEMWEYFRLYINNNYQHPAGVYSESKFFVTEQGDVSHQLRDVENKLTNLYNPGDAMLAISKNVDKADLRAFLIKHAKYTIFHATITGYGGTELEPGAAPWQETIAGLNSLIEEGFPAKQVVLRVDPIIPTPQGIDTAQQVVQACHGMVRRIRFSFIDGYKHVKYLLPWDTFHAPAAKMTEALMMLRNNASGRSLEACGESTVPENKGCISTTDYKILGLEPPPESRKGQRKGCLCLGNKTELLVKPEICSNGCKYCYYKLGILPF